MSCSWCFMALLLVLVSCTHDAREPQLYEAVFGTEPTTVILVERVDSTWVVCNGAERIRLRSQKQEAYKVPVFGGSWKGAWEGGEWVGFWTDSLRSADYKVPLTLKPILDEGLTPHRSERPDTSFWATTEGLLVMATRDDSMWATISTPTGDYRYLAGKKHLNKLVFSNFDGAHLFRFEVSVKGDSLVNGEFLSGTHYRTAFSGRRLASMPTAWKSATQAATSKELTFLGIRANGDTLRWTNSLLENEGKKGLVLDIMGTWCPNCMDEARLLQEFASDYPEVQFLSLAFERSSGADALARLEAFRTEMELPWEILLGGKASKSEAASVLSAVDTVRSFPTTIFWPLKGEPTIHQGFNGPATGEGFEIERAFFRSELNRISGRLENH